MDMIAAGGLLWMYVCVYDCAGVIQRWTDGSLRAICCMRRLERGFIRDRMHAVVPVRFGRQSSIGSSYL
jgi:hypothetical protein